jgi:hypothetical protein
VPVPGELIERFLRENHGDRERTVHALFNFITAEMISNPDTWTMPPKEIRRRVCACVDKVLDDQRRVTKVS